MDSSTHPVINPTPRPDLVDRLSGSDVCRHCSGRGSILVTGPRDRRECPMCRGRGVRLTTATMRPSAEPF